MDVLLKRLAEVAPPVTLGRIDDAVLAAWAAEQRERATQSRIVSVAAIMALGLGFAGGSLSTAPTPALPTLSPFATTALAPSDLLDAR